MTAGQLTQSFARVSRETFDGAIARFMRIITELPSTNWILFTGSLASGATTLVYLSGILLDRAPEPVTFGMWLTFLGSWMGIAVRQFRIKRETHSELSPQAKPAAPAP